MKLSTRLGLVGIGALGMLSLVHLSRKLHYVGPEAYLYLLGVLPNFAAAIAIPYVLVSIWAEQNESATWSAVRRWFLTISLVSGIALIVWEFIQQTSRTLVFDVDDIGATFIGLAVGYALFVRVVPKPMAERCS